MQEACLAASLRAWGCGVQALDQLIGLEDTTIVLVAHRLSTVKDADKICVLGDAKILESGTHDELMTNVRTTRLC